MIARRRGMPLRLSSSGGLLRGQGGHKTSVKSLAPVQRLSPGSSIKNIKSPMIADHVHSGVSPIMVYLLSSSANSRNGRFCNRTTWRSHDATKTSVHPTCTRDVRDRLHKRKVLES